MQKSFITRTSIARGISWLPIRRPYLTLTSLSFRVSELRREVVRGTKWEASSSEVDVDSIAASISRLRVGSGTVRETSKSHYSRRTRRVARSASYPVDSAIIKLNYSPLLLDVFTLSTRYLLCN